MKEQTKHPLVVAIEALASKVVELEARLKKLESKKRRG